NKSNDHNESLVFPINESHDGPPDPASGWNCVARIRRTTSLSMSTPNANAIARQFACSPKCHCAVSFRGPRRSVLSSGLWALADGDVWGKIAVGISAGPTFYENAAESRFLRRRPSAKHALAASLECTNRR